MDISFTRLLMRKAGALPSFGIKLTTGIGLPRNRTCYLHMCNISTRPTNCSTDCPREKKKKVIVITGPTGAGKSRLALNLAKRLDGEIISADSVQIYRGLDVGSAKPTLAEQKIVPHHLINILNPSEEYSAGQFFEDARKATNEVLSKGKVPLVTGGTGLYLRWFIYGKPEVPKASVDVTYDVCSELKHLQEKDKWDEAVELVVKAGNSEARTIPLNNWYRLRRSLEIIRSSGFPPSAFVIPYESFKKQPAFEQRWSDPAEKELDYDFICLFLTSPRVDLYRAIDLRCEEMLRETEGLLSEASWLLNIGLRPNMSSATRAIGYRQAMKYLLECRNYGGRSTADNFKAFLYEFQKASRNFAKRQMTWFRSEFLYHRIDSSSPLDDVVDFICSAYEQTEKLMVPSNLLMTKNADVRQKNYELKSYRTQNMIFKKETDCGDVLDWVWRTQQG
ncbi:tRNA dimethylallyltransferase 9 [Dendrobium catenatum]|uniref:tRNA dimethylallyltransferase n=1 Tax=Dendrobium catenatum TaxID=906689 RepID=A0A2I0VE03_9ASPA|nr:tRNA dimethylallyltransferase 9 [Dendrobium catenatum]PKU61649.1 tRNA dimethylallyltransferase 9 [Dendrobium catenatum]